jgi:hypothetical protein
MGYEELKMLNSDFTREPLNYLSYINSLEAVGEKSYVLDSKNDKIWKDLIVNSSLLYRSSTIHDIVYNRLEEDDVEMIIKKHKNLSGVLNIFYDTDVFNGDLDTLVKSTTKETIGALGSKFIQAIASYANETLGGEEGIKWVKETYSLDLKDYTDWASIVQDIECWDRISEVSEAMTVMSLCKNFLEPIVTIDSRFIYWNKDKDKYYNENGTVFDANGIATGDSISKDTLNTLIANQAVTSDTVDEAEIRFEKAIDIFVANEIAYEVLVERSRTDFIKKITAEDGFKEYCTADSDRVTYICTTTEFTSNMDSSMTSDMTQALVKIRTDALASSFSDDSIYFAELSDDKEALERVLGNGSVLRVLVGNDTAFNILVANTTSLKVIMSDTAFTSLLADSGSRMEIVAASSTAMNAVIASSTAMNAVAASSTAMNAVAASSTAMNAVIASSTAMNAVIASSTAMNAVAASSTAMNAVIASSTAMNAVIASSTAMNAVIASSTAMNAVAASSTAMISILDSTWSTSFTTSTLFNPSLIPNKTSVFTIGRQITLKWNTYNVVFDVCQHASAGVTLVSKNSLTNKQWHNSNTNNYQSSDIRTWLNGTCKSGFSANVQNSMKTTSVSCHSQSTAQTCSDKVWMPSATELGYSGTYVPVEGTKYGYIDTASKYGTNVDGTTCSCAWTRTPYSNHTASAWYVTSSGFNYANCSTSPGVPVAFNL